jgi:hypothetical protein
MADKPRTDEDVLREALLYALREPEDLELHHAVFGRYADGSGCYWLLQFLRRIDNGKVEQPSGGMDRRLAGIVHAWIQGFRPNGPEPDSDPNPPGHP